MSAHGPSRTITLAQVVGVLAFTLALFFVVAFATKSAEAYRLKNWRDALKDEIAGLERRKVEIEEEVRVRQLLAWVQEALRDAGRVPADVVRVVPVTTTPRLVVAPNLAATPDPAARPMSHALPTVTPAPTRKEALFDNPHWGAWARLIWGTSNR